MDVWTKDHPFPIDIDYMITDTLELLRPKMTLCSSLEEAIKQVAELEREVLVKLGKVMPIIFIRFIMTYFSVCRSSVIPA